MNYCDAHLFVGDAAELLVDCLHRSVNVAFNDDVELLDFSLLDLIVEIAERDNTLAPELLFASGLLTPLSNLPGFAL